jgi:gas vesicle protein
MRASQSLYPPLCDVFSGRHIATGHIHRKETSVMTMSDDPSAETPIFDSRRDALDPEAGLPETVLPGGSGGQTSGGYSGGTSGDYSGGTSGGESSGVREEAGRVADSAAEAGKDVAATAAEQARNVAGEAKYQARDLYRQTQQELREQAAQQQERVASGLRSVGDELEQMAAASETDGVASDLVRQAAQRTHAVAGWLDARDPGSLIDEVKSYARRNPGTFIAAAAIAGALAGRLTRALASGGDGAGDSTGRTTVGTTPATGITAAGTTPIGGATAGTPTIGGAGTLYGEPGDELPDLPGAGYTGGRA